MISVLPLAWFTVALGVAIALALGWFGPAGFWATVGLLFADVLVALGLTYALYYAFAFCHDNLKMCAQTDERNVWFLAAPLMAIPVYWTATLIAKLAHLSRASKNETGAS